MTISSALLDSKEAIKELFNEEYSNTTRQRLSRLIKDGHIKAIKKFGVTRFHRKTFQPIHKILSLKK